MASSCVSDPSAQSRVLSGGGEHFTSSLAMPSARDPNTISMASSCVSEPSGSSKQFTGNPKTISMASS
eukprot:CAMPEP_0201692848 /NCGR_PEP_ID=MMETSP0578-20130828/5627_1 /ASSEMBLY_ACC=CAM_ASM_000663 /TAXON_ID=267565 /ORGANISM="Skeletonema grethea, Strain CCMP 1804" /LENGTH=67 /DNA_ID=CAMNT_0048178287 /DNA_START=23 /DNA_END=223 /DNA_ORIENTATION=-